MSSFFRFLIAISTILFCLTKAQTQLTFKNITMEDGLPDDGVEWVIQDHLGFIWFATRVGMVKYDGYEYHQYKSGDPNSVGLNKDRIRVLFEDSRGDVWGGADGFLNRYIRSRDTVITYQSSENNPNALKGEGVYSIIEDSEGRMWFGNYRGWINYVDKIELENEDYTISFSQLKEEDHEETYIVFNLFEDSRKNIWACTRNGLLKIKDLQVEVIQVKPGKKFDRNNTFFTIIEDEDNKFWVGTYGNGLAYYDDFEKIFDFYPARKSEFRRYNSNNILSLLKDKNGNLWCGTQLGGLLKFNSKTKTYDIYRNHNTTTSILSGYFHNLFQDNSGTIWIPVFQTGVSRIDQSLNQIERFYYGKENFVKDIIYCFYESTEGKIWVGTNNGLKLYDPITKYFSEVNIIKDQDCENRIVALNIVEDIKGNLWFHGGWYRSVMEYNPKTKKIKCYGKGDNELSSPLVSGIESDNDGYIWISTYGGGLNRIDINTKKFTRYHVAGPQSKRDDPEEINVMDKDTDGNLWVASYDRTLNQFDREYETFIRTSFKDFGGGFNATAMMVDTKNRIWLATRQGGIIQYDLTTENIKKFTKQDGLPVNDRIYNFFEDSEGNIYSTSHNMLIKINNSGELDTYYEFDIGEKDLISAAYLNATNEIFLSTAEQLIVFNPDKMKPNPIPPKMIISNFKYYDKSIERITSASGNINLVKYIELKHYQNDITITFAGLHYTNSFENQYKFILENYDDYWHEAGKSRTARYTNLSHGEYLFKVLGSNSDGVWANIPAELKIVILPPWWLTWWAYTLYGILIALTISLTWIMQLRRIRIKNELKMKEFETRKLKEVDQMKSNFFANISHEFRTPLTLIKGPVKELLYEERSTEKTEVFKMVLRNTDKLLNLINELLDLSKLEAGKMKLCAGNYDIVSFTKGIVMSFNSLADSKEIQLKIKSKQNYIGLYFDKEKIQKIISNIIANALKFTPERGVVEVDISDNVTDDTLVIRIKDSGIGVPENELPKLFDRFYQVIRNGYDQNTGTGIGLALTKELVQIHKGTIEVDSEVNKGTIFTLSFPMGREHLSDDEIIFSEEINFDYPAVEILNIEEEPESKKDKKKILIVEDNKEVLNYIKGIVEKEYTSILALNGEDGLNKAKDIIPDLIVSDIMMPLMDGNEMCSLIKEDEKTSHIPVILLTAKGDEGDRIKGFETGADDYIIKPFDPVELIVRIKNLITQRMNLRRKYLREAEIHPADVAVTSIDKKFIEKVISYVESHLYEESLSVEEMAKYLNMSRSQLYRKFCGLLGEKPNEFIRKYRLNRAAKLLRENFGNVAQVAYEVGFSDPAYFSKCFRKVFKMNPHEYEKKYADEEELKVKN